MKLFRHLLVSMTVALVFPALAFRSPQQDRLENYEKQDSTLTSGAADTKQQAAAVSTLKAANAKVQVHFDPVTGSAVHVHAQDSFLTGADIKLVKSDPYGPTKKFLDSHKNLFGHGSEVLRSAITNRDFVTAHNGLHTVVWQQHVDNIPVFEGVLISHTSANGELVSISSHFLPDAAPAAVRGTPNKSKALAAPVVSAKKAVALAAANLGDVIDATQVTSVGNPSGHDKKQKLRAPFAKGEIDMDLTWLPLDKDNLRLCWDVLLMSRARGEMFRILVDAQTEEVLIRRNLTDYLSNVSYRVYTSDSPSPMSPGWATPTNLQPPVASRTLVTLSALDTNASPAGWIDDGGNETRGNNVDAHTDRNNDNQADLPRPQGSPFRVFDYSMDLTQSPTTYTNAAVVQLFYLCNWMHDRLYQLGFTEAAGNFQSNNFGRGGTGNDALQADAQDGGGFNNANFSTPPDGSAGRMQMYIFNSPSPARDGDFDAEVVLHEYTHGLSNRRVGGGIGISALQPSGMGEGWSDWYGLTLLSEAGDDVNGNYAAGAYVTYQLSGMAQNYYFGIRRYPYTTDMTKNPLTLKDIDPAQASAHPGIPRSSIIGSTANEVHNMGEVWCVTLWDMRANLINKYGWAIGNQLALQLVTDGMNLSPANPNFLQARDAILQADLVDNGGANRAQLWSAFAKRGMGVSATSPSSSSTTGIHEAFDLPDDLAVLPQTLSSSGLPGGPFAPPSVSFVVTNTGSNALSWTLMTTSSWMNVSPLSSTLPAGSGTTVTVSPNSAANLFGPGIYTASIWFTNLTSGIAQTRQFKLAIVGQNMFDDFDPGIDLTQWSDFGGVVGSTVLATNYGGSISGVNSLWFGDDGTRDATTFPMDTHNGGVISFYLRLASGPSYPWENVDLPGEGVAFEYSTNSGTSWTIAGTYNTPAYFNWTFVTMPVPSGALSSFTLFRWRQLSHSGSCCDHWALDDVFISTAPLAPVITSQPQSQTNVVGDQVTLSVMAFGTVPLAYQWTLNGTNIPGATTNSLVFTNIQFSDAGTYAVTVTNSVGGTNSANALLAVVPIPPCTAVPPGLVSWWRGEGNAQDEEGFNPGVLLGSASYAQGRVGAGFLFDGVTGGVLLSNRPSLQLQTLTIETWIKRASSSVVSSGSAGNGTFLGCGPGGYFFWIRSDGAVAFNVLGEDALFSGFSVADTNYHHIAVSDDGTKLNFYLDGMLYPGPNYSRTFTNNTPIGLGIRADNGDNSFNGLIDEMSIYNRALTSSEIAGIFSARNSGKCTVPTAPFIISQPTNQTAVAGGSASFNVLAGGSTPLSYRWLFNGTNLPGATTNPLVLLNIQTNSAGNYAVLVSNSVGSVTSSIATLTVTSAPSCVSVPAGIVSWWKGDLNALDQAGINNGTLTGNTSYSNGEVGQAFAFDGAGDGVLLGNPAGLQLQTLSIEAWIKRTSTSVASFGSGGNATLFGAGSGGYYFWLRNDGAIGFNLVNDPAYVSSFIVTDTNYHHVAVTRNGSTITFYLDGSAYVGPSYNPAFAFTTSFGIGIRPDNLDNSFYGSIDELSIYNRALTTNEVQAIYLAGAGGKCSGSTPPAILSQPQPTNQTVIAGSTVNYNIVASGTPPLTYQWKVNGTNLSGRTTAALILSNAQPANSGVYSCAVTNGFGFAISSNASLTVISGLPPSITLQPSNTTVTAGGSANFSVSASGTTPLSYFWRRNGISIPGATTTSYSTNNVQLADSGAQFTCLVSNAFGSQTSAIATLTVTSSSGSCVSLPAGAVGWWPAEGNAVDLISSNNGVLHGSVTFSPGLVGQAFRFGSTSPYVSIAASPSLNVGTNAGFTMECWINPSDTSSTHILGEYNNGAGSIGMHWYHSDPGIGGLGALAANLVTTGGSDNIFASAPNTITSNSFQHVALSYNKTSGVAKLYRNGAVVASNSVGSITPQTSFPLNLGARLSGSAAVGSYFTGLMDETTLYNRALTDAEIAAIYNGGSAGKCSGSAPSITTQPQSQSVTIGSNATFTVSATGASPLQYQWRKGTTGIAGATNTSYSIASVQTNDSGVYSVVVSNTFGVAVSSNATLVVTVPSNTCLAVPPNLVSWWRAEGNAADFPGVNNGTLVGSVVFTNGMSGQAFSFDGISSHVRVPDSASLHFTNAFTLEAWVRPTSHGNYHEIFSKWDLVGSGQKSYVLQLLPDGRADLTACADGNDGFNTSADSTNSLPLNQWTHLAGTYDGSSLRMYVNGVLQAQVAYTFGVFPGAHDLGIGGTIGGASPGQVGNVFAGQIDEASVYSRALAASEIQAINSAGTGGKCSPNHVPIAANMNAATKQNVPITIPADKFVALGSDPDNDSLSLISVSSTSTNGGAVILGSNQVTYTPATNFIGADRFTYVLDDGRGGTASAFVFVQVRGTNQLSGNMLPIVAVPGGYQVSFLGVPGLAYTLQRATNVSGPWTSLGTVIPNSSGLGAFADSNAPPGSAFYRTTYP